MKTRSNARAAADCEPGNPRESTFLPFVEGVRSQVEAELRRRLAREMRALKPVGPEAVSACAALSDVCLRGGKRLRAALVCAGARCFQKRPNDALLIQIGAAVEVLHAYFLVHDDWIDGDLMRRGGPSAHATLRERYGNALGDAAAVLAGDWGAAVANDWMAQLKSPPRTLTRLLAAFSDMQRAAIGGQLRDTLVRGTDIERTYQLKTASYTVQGPLSLGAIAGGAGVDDLRTLRKFSLPVGVAFQLRDDLIGLFEPETVTGKPFGSDLRAGKYTAAAVYALNHAHGAERRLLLRVFGNRRASRRQLVQAVQAMESLGARSQVERRIRSLLGLANRSLRKATIREDGRELLVSAANALALRST